MLVNACSSSVLSCVDGFNDAGKAQTILSRMRSMYRESETVHDILSQVHRAQRAEERMKDCASSFTSAMEPEQKPSSTEN